MSENTTSFVKSRVYSRPILKPLSAALLLTVSLSGCPGPTPMQPASKPDKQASTAPPPPATCQANASWITAPTMPSEVAATESFCDFYQFSWQWFLAQVSPAVATNPTGDRVFETNRLHDPNPKSLQQCTTQALTGRANAAKMLGLRGVKPHDFEEEQADGSALYDQNGNILYYNIWYSQGECNATSAGFAAGTMEIKISWKILTQPDPSFFTMEANVPEGSLIIGGKPTGVTRKVTLGLVGIHLVNWTPNHPEMIWATFEHKNNAPLCDGSSAAPASGWSLTSSAAAQCLASNPQTSAGPPNTKCASFNFNTPAKITGNTPPTMGTPNNICRQYDNGNQPGTSVNGNDNAANLLAIQQLNAAINGTNGLLTQTTTPDAMKIWQNYHMIGGLWTKGGAASGNEPVPSVDNNGNPVPADPTSLQRGSLELTNMTMETFEQGDTSEVPNCFGCHNYIPTSPLKVSHISKSLFPASIFTAPGTPAPTAASSAPTAAPAAKQ